jgi:ECF transporter S component (folate family)
MNKTKKIILCALFLSSTIVLGRILSIRTPIITIGFSFVPIMLSAIILGPKYSTFIATLADIIGALVFPTGSFFFGFTITAFLTGLTYGLLLYRKDFKVDKWFIIRLLVSTVIVTGILNGVLNTIWIIMMTNGASKVIITTRVLKQLVMAPVKIITILLIGKIFGERINKLMHD